jgi:DNA-binding CsgD family transcriptional regulator
MLARDMMQDEAADLAKTNAVQLIRRWFEEAWRDGRVEVASEIFAPHFVLHSQIGDIRDLELLKSSVLEFRTALEAWTGDWEICGENGRYVCTFWFEGRHTGPLFGSPPTGERMQYRSTETVVVDGCLVVEAWQSCNYRYVTEAPSLVVSRTNALAQCERLWQLTPREASVAKLIMDGLSDKEIAVRLALATASVSKYVGTILRKSDAPTRTQLAERAGVVRVG